MSTAAHPTSEQPLPPSPDILLGVSVMKIAALNAGVLVRAVAVLEPWHPSSGKKVVKNKHRLSSDNLLADRERLCHSGSQ